MEIKNRTIYVLEIRKNGKRNSFDYETEDEAYKALEFLAEKYKDNKILDKGTVTSADDIIQLSICKTYVGSVPKGAIANYSPNEWFRDAHEEITLSATEYHVNHK
ncbi:hypothetical protein [Peribacillus frigoritolerans]|uniref:hypothetical protein n=1 Tax=Peribacillus frigoritolerans TaxID=450367 RepID=UPI0039A16C74